jgi:pilus assembly protein CpaE
MKNAESIGMSAMCLLLIGPDERRRRAIANVFVGSQATIARELERYPAVDDIAELLQSGYDGVLIDLDANSEQALDVIENLCGMNNSITVMAYSARSDSSTLVRCMRAGAREFLSEPVASDVAAEALVRAAARRDEIRRQKTKLGKLLVFTGAKGGCGVTTVASNYAVALAKYGKTALIDLDLYLGDAALTLGLTTPFTVLDAFDNLTRLDSDYLAGLMTKHASGLNVLGAPDKIPSGLPPMKGVEPLLRLARTDYDYVVVDAGSCSMEAYETLFETASTVYLVTQVSVADLRNANRIVTRYFSGVNSETLEVVMNRYNPKEIEINEEAITKAVTRPAKWRIPNDFVAAHRAQNIGVPLVQEKTQIGRSITDMAMAAAGRAEAPEKKKRFSLFGL